MEKKTKNLFRVLFMTCTLAMTIGLVATLSIGTEKERIFDCKTDKLLAGFTVQNAENEYPNGTGGKPSYSLGLEYSTNQSNGGTGQIDSPFEASVSRGSCTDTAVTLPEFYKSGNFYYKVIGIDPDGFNANKPAKDENGSDIGCYDLTSISSLKDFTLVGSQAFAYTSLTTVEFSSNLTELSPSTFFHCKNLETTNFIRLPNQAASETGTYSAFSSVGNNCFADCVKYTGIVLPRTLTNIGDGAYQNCKSLTSIFLPATEVEGQHLEVGNYAFAGCSNVTVVFISSKVEKIGSHAFEGCINAKGYSALTYTALLAKLQAGGSAEDWNYLFNDSRYDNGGDYDVFLDFSGRDSKTDLRYEPPYFYSFNSTGGVTLDLYDGNYSNITTDTYLYNVIRTIPSTRGGHRVTEIGERLFLDNTDMTELYIPSSVKIIGRAAFAGCSNLTTIGLSGGLETIEDFAFAPWNDVGTERKANSLKSLTIPASVQWIGDYAFPYMYEVMNIKFEVNPESTPENPQENPNKSDIYHIGKHAFEKAGYDYKDQCYQGGSFTEVRNALVIKSRPPVDGTLTFGSNKRPDSNAKVYTEICDYAFSGNMWIGAIRISAKNLVVDAYVFYECNWLVEADLGSGLTVMGNTKNAHTLGLGFQVGFTFAMNDGTNSANDLGGPLEDDADVNAKPFVPMSTLYIENELSSGRYVGKGTLEGRYQTMVYTGASNDTNNFYFFRWDLDTGANREGYADIEPAYVDRGVPATSNGSPLAATKKPANFSNDAYTGSDSSYLGYNGVDLAVGDSYLDNTYTDNSGRGTWNSASYKIRQGGYFGVSFAHATITENNGTYTATYEDSSGNPITSLDDNVRYGFTLYDSETGRAKFDFVQKKGTTDELILSKFHYNPYWEQSRHVTIPAYVTFGGRPFKVSEIGNCAFFRNICPQSHAWVKTTDNKGNVTELQYISPQDDSSDEESATYNPNKDSSGQYYADHNDDFYNLESVTLPNTIARIGGNAFYMCTALQSLTTTGKTHPVEIPGEEGEEPEVIQVPTEGRFPDTIKNIQQYAFAFTGLSTVILPSTIENLGNQHGLCNPFTGCMSLSTIRVEGNGSYFKSSDNILLNGDGTHVVLGPLKPENTEIEIPDDVTTLDSLSFRGGRTITNIVIPASLTTIRMSCFDVITNGEIGRMDSYDLTQAPDVVYKGIYSTNEAQLDTMTVKDDEDSSLETIESFAFYYCKQFDGIQFKNVLQNIGERAFYHCDDANEYYIPNSLTTIGKQAFYKNKKFNTIKTDGKPNGETAKYLNLAATHLTNIGSEAFNNDNNANNFNTLSLPGSLLTINNGPIFTKGYNTLSTVYIHENTRELNAAVFQSHTLLSTFKTWSGNADGNGDIQNPSENNKLPSGLTVIGQNCFSGCTSLASFSEFPATLTTVGASAFSGCNNNAFTTADFSKSTANLTIKGNAFYNCKKLKTVTFVDAPGSRDKAGGTLTIETNAFQSCNNTGFTSIIIPRGSTVGAFAFRGASSLTDIYVCDTYANANANNTIPATIVDGTDADVYYYVEKPSDATNITDQNVKFWNYNGGTTPVEYHPNQA